MNQQENKSNKIKELLLRWLFKRSNILILAICAVVVVALLIFFSIRKTSIGVNDNENTGFTVTQIQQIKTLGEWEFLSISTEEMVDSTRHGFFGDAELVSIYYGTLHLGINFRDAKPGWAKLEGDSLIATLPPIKLLDNNFIDEAKTVSFFEKGSWDAKARQEMYQKAYKRIYNRCMTKENITSAQENAEMQMKNFFRAMGIQKINIQFEETKK